MKHQFFFIVTLFAAALFSSKSVEALNFKNVNVEPGSTLQGKNDTYISENFHNDGDVTYKESLSINCNRVTGKGIIKAPNISITAKKFDFKGTIDCSENCSITSLGTVNENAFKRVGEGKFKINGVDFSKKSTNKGKVKSNNDKKRVHPPLNK